MINHADFMVGYEAALAKPQVFPLASLIYPSSPQVLAQEFLTIQASGVYPTTRTPWSSYSLQSLKIPDL
jgi:hypothetical protein